MYKPIRDYAIIGNLRSAVLVSKDGSIDWAPAPFIDSPSVFAAILDEQQGGFWQIKPREKYTVQQQYIEHTNILVTEFRTGTGTLQIIDFIPIEEERTFVPAEEDTTFKIHRKVLCTEGICDVDVEFYPRFNYARGKTELSSIGGGVYMQNEERHGVLAAECELEIKGDRVVAHTTLSKGESNFFIFSIQCR